MSGKRRAPAPSTRRAAPVRGRSGPRTKPDKGRHPRLRRAFKWVTLLGLGGLLLLVGVAVVVYQAVDLPKTGNADFKTETSFVYYGNGTDEVGRFATQNRESIPLAEMPQTVKDAVIAIENPTFYTDRGIDPKGILRAAFNNAQGGDTQGGSTITQQYVKVLYLNQERSYTRKIKEAVLALKLQQRQSKDEILEGYLNTIYFGNGSYGVQAAAKSYFGIPAAQLDLRQSASLAAVLNSPSYFDPYGKDSKKRLRDRYRVVLDEMAETGTLTAEEADKAGRRLPDFEPVKTDSTYGGQKGHMLELVRNELRQRGYSETEIEGGGLRVTTTFDPAAMANAEKGVADVRPAIGDDQLHVAVATVEPGTGALRGFYGGQDYLTSQINWAAAGGMVGSTFKPFSMAAALGDGFSITDTFDGNSPYEFPDGATVQNEGEGEGNDYGSAVSGITAMEESINTAFIDMSARMDNGPERILQVANRMGIPPVEADVDYPGIPETSRDLEADSRITLGKARVSAINMANAFATLANDGKRADVHVIEKVVSPDGKHDYDRSTTEGAVAERAITSDIAADVSYTLQQTVADGTGANAQAIDRPAAGKTGTATNDDDEVSSSWFVGYTPQLATAVMYVRGDGDDQLDDDWLPSYNGAAGYFGSNYPTRTWAAVMAADLEGTEVVEFPEPEYVDGDAPGEDTSSSESDDDGVYVPPAPQPTRQPSQQPSQKPSQKPTRAPDPTPTQAPPTTQAPAPPPPPTPTLDPVPPPPPPTTAPTLPPTTAPTTSPPASPVARKATRRR